MIGLAILVGAIVAAGIPAGGQTPKRGGILNPLKPLDSAETVIPELAAPRGSRR